MGGGVRRLGASLISEFFAIMIENPCLLLTFYRKFRPWRHYLGAFRFHFDCIVASRQTSRICTCGRLRRHLRRRLPSSGRCGCLVLGLWTWNECVIKLYFERNGPGDDRRGNGPYSCQPWCRTHPCSSASSLYQYCIRSETGSLWLSRPTSLVLNSALLARQYPCQIKCWAFYLTGMWELPLQVLSTSFLATSCNPYSRKRPCWGHSDRWHYVSSHTLPYP